MKCDGDTIPRPFSIKSKLNISLDQYSNVSHSLLLWYAKLGAIMELVSLPHSLQKLLKKKYLSCYVLLPDQISMSGCFYFVRYHTICVM